MFSKLTAPRCPHGSAFVVFHTVQIGNADFSLLANHLSVTYPRPVATNSCGNRTSHFRVNVIGRSYPFPSVLRYTHARDVAHALRTKGEHIIVQVNNLTCPVDTFRIICIDK